MIGTYAQVITDLSFLNTLLAMTVSVGAGVIVLSDKIQEGLIQKIGLCILSLAQFATAVMLMDGTPDGDTIGLLRAQTCTRIGLVVLGLGVFWQYSEARKKASVFFTSSQQNPHI
jgi:hypothetical protein